MPTVSKHGNWQQHLPTIKKFRQNIVKSFRIDSIRVNIDVDSRIHMTITSIDHSYSTVSSLLGNIVIKGEAHVAFLLILPSIMTIV
jgi:hypothetical protein